MLVLTRRLGESIVLGDDIVVTVVSIRREKVRLGITAPKNVSVHRHEIQLLIEQAAQKAASDQSTTELPGSSSSSTLSPLQPEAPEGQPSPSESEPEQQLTVSLDHATKLGRLVRFLPRLPRKVASFLSSILKGVKNACVVA